MKNDTKFLLNFMKRSFQQPDSGMRGEIHDQALNHSND